MATKQMVTPPTSHVAPQWEDRCMLIAMAGLPATGKSQIAERLSTELGAVVLSKDTVRPKLFPPPVLDYSREVDDICMAAICAGRIHSEDLPKAEMSS